MAEERREASRGENDATNGELLAMSSAPGGFNTKEEKTRY
jgi:hypothetical protein